MRGGAKVVEMSRGGGELVEDQQVLPPRYFCDKLLQKFDGLGLGYFGRCLWPFFVSAQFCDSLSQNLTSSAMINFSHGLREKFRAV